mgnify:CR=1 FL=1
MTVQELIDALNAVEDKSLDVVFPCYFWYLPLLFGQFTSLPYRSLVSILFLQR